MLATDGTWHELKDAVRDDWRGAVAASFVASLVLALVVAVFLFGRRMSGSLESQLAPVPLALTAAALLAWSCAVRLRLCDRRIDWLLATVLALFAVAFSFPGDRSIDWLVWLAVFAAYGLIRPRRNSPTIGSDKRAEQVLQQLTRSRTADGCETIRGTLIAEFAPSERTAVIHVAFCPPFEWLPSIECEAIDGPACDVKVAQVLHQGTRLETRLFHASTAAERVTIEILATDHPPVTV
ncbi:MAG: hypothetical protein WD971_10465 [Pirellulales bacterium]